MRLELPVLIVAGLVALLIWRARSRPSSSSSSPPSSPGSSSPSSPSSPGESPFGRDADGLPQVMA